jgi:hypothetical protein
MGAFGYHVWLPNLWKIAPQRRFLTEIPEGWYREATVGSALAGSGGTGLRTFGARAFGTPSMAGHCAAAK